MEVQKNIYSKDSSMVHGIEKILEISGSQFYSVMEVFEFI